MFSKPAGLGSAQGTFIERDDPARWLVQALKKGCDCRFARTGRTNNGDAFARTKGEGEIGKDGYVGPGGVGKVDIGESNVAGNWIPEVSRGLGGRVAEFVEAIKIGCGSFDF